MDSIVVTLPESDATPLVFDPDLKDGVDAPLLSFESLAKLVSREYDEKPEE